MNAHARPFLAGVPTKPDVDRLRKAFGIPAVGVVIKWDEFEQVLQLNRSTHRFKVVLSSWRKSLFREHHVLIAAERGVGLVRLDNNGNLVEAVKKEAEGWRRIGRSIRILSITDRNDLTPENKVAADRLELRIAAVKLAAATAAKALPAPDLSKK